VSDDTSSAAATEKLSASNKKNNLRRSFPKKRPVGRPRADGSPPGSPRPEAPPGEPAKVTAKLPQLPAELVPFAACAPLMVTARGLSMATKVPVEQIAPSPKAQEQVVEAFKLWLSTLPIEIHPGYALLAAYGLALVDMTMMTMAQAKAMKDAQEKAAGEKKPSKKPTPSGDAGGGNSEPAAPSEEAVAGPVNPEHVNGAPVDTAARA